MKPVLKHWLTLRATSLPLIPLTFYFMTQFPKMTSSVRTDVISWIEDRGVMAALVVFIVCAYYHAQLGMEEIILDYVPEQQQSCLLTANKFFFLALGIVSVLAVLAISFGSL